MTKIIIILYQERNNFYILGMMANINMFMSHMDKYNDIKSQNVYIYISITLFMIFII